MDLIDAKELWRYIPPEEKIDLLNKSHGQGILAAFIAMIVAGTCAAARIAPVRGFITTICTASAWADSTSESTACATSLLPRSAGS